MAAVWKVATTNGAEGMHRQAALQVLLLRDSQRQRQTQTLQTECSAPARARRALDAASSRAHTVAEEVGYAPAKVRKAGVDGCELQRCTRSDLTLFVTERQIRVSYACRHSNV